MKTPVIGIVLAAIVLALAIALRGPADDDKSATGARLGEQAAARSAKASSETVLAIAPGQRRSSAAAAIKSRMTPLMTEFVASRDEKSIYERLKKLPNPTAEELYV